MASKAVAVDYAENGTILVTVEHLDTDSFARSVDRAARAAWRKHPRVQQLATNHVAANYAMITEGRKCWSLVAFAPDFQTAYREVGRP